MPEIGYALSSEDHPPNDLVRFARDAEEAGFEFALISDHFHPWIDAQGQSPFVWSVIGAIAHATERLRLGTGVTCPTMRIHPAIVAHAAATSAAMMPGRFFLGVGTGENLNEHVLGDRWPAPDERIEMLDEAVEVIRLLWQGGFQTHRGKHYTVDHARLYTLPEEPPEVVVAGAQPIAAELAARIGDGFANSSPDPEVVERYESAGGDGPKYGMLHVCYQEDEGSARRLAHELWPNTALPGGLGQELATPVFFEQAAEAITEEDVAEKVPCGPDPERHAEAMREFEQAGYTHVWVHQIGDNQREFLEFFAREVVPKVS
jgi:coenzyme F420-dependent glucose-6-phosphate dehydrogenase